MPRKKVKFVFNETSERRNQFPSSVLVHQISVLAAKLIWDEKISIQHPFAKLAMQCQNLRSEHRAKTPNISKTRYTPEFEDKCREFLRQNTDKIDNMNNLEGVSDIVRELKTQNLLIEEVPKPSPAKIFEKA